MARYIPDIRAIRSFVPFVILYANFITNFTNVPNATNFNMLFSGKPLDVQARYQRPFNSFWSVENMRLILKTVV
ncbi:MAG: hypothetical protein EF813_08675 [Methanosarcinales archaeon]|nr:MAG: hypothetical protein EF813_08675 [Methanosarcinales archaeon]